MSRYSSHDPYLDPASGVLKNRFGITDQATLEATEASLVALRSYALAQQPLAGGFDLAHLQAIHRCLFGDVYEWAGQLRTIDIAKGGNAFAHHTYIAVAAAPIFAALAREKHLEGLAPPAFSARAAHYLGEVNALHPFREGNRRAKPLHSPRRLVGSPLWAPQRTMIGSTDVRYHILPTSTIGTETLQTRSNVFVRKGFASKSTTAQRTSRTSSNRRSVACWTLASVNSAVCGSPTTFLTE